VSEHYKEGRTPLHTFRADIDYSLSEAHTTYGRLELKFGFAKEKFLENEIYLSDKQQQKLRQVKRKNAPGRGPNGKPKFSWR
jgi:small subunit ribosomal protein S3